MYYTKATQLEQRLVKILAKATGGSVKKWQQYLSQSHVIFEAEAVKRGLISQILM